MSEPRHSLVTDRGHPGVPSLGLVNYYNEGLSLAHRRNQSAAYLGLLEGKLGGCVVPGGVGLPPPLGQEQHRGEDVVQQPRPAVKIVT